MHPFFPVDYEENSFFYLFKMFLYRNDYCWPFFKATVRKAFQNSFFCIQVPKSGQKFSSIVWRNPFTHLHAVASCSGETAAVPAALSLRRRTLLSAPLRAVPRPTANARRTAALCLKLGKQKSVGFWETQCELIACLACFFVPL